MPKETKSIYAVDNLPAPVDCLILIVAYVGMVVTLFGSCKVAYSLLQRPVVEELYGPQSYADGLRVVGRQGQLSDGRRLPDVWNLALGLGTFLLSLPIWLGYCAILAVLGLMPPDRLIEGWKDNSKR